MSTISLEPLDLAALLCSRVCHDVISPVGAIVNGLEVLEEEKDESMREIAMDLIRKSARQASARLQFARIAFGAAGSAGAAIDTGDAEQVAKGFMSDDKLKLSWEAARVFMPKNKVKLLLNMLMLAGGCIPRGGTIAVKVEGDAETPRFIIRAEGTNPRIPPHAEELLAGRSEQGSIDAHAIQPFYTGLVANAAAMRVTFAKDDAGVTLLAEPV
jgi:histidine phosphotransferase ChpT